MSRRCYNFEPSGHRYEPLDGWQMGNADFVTRLYCTKCGRISIASVENNTSGWQADLLPPQSQADFFANLPPQKSDA